MPDIRVAGDNRIYVTGASCAGVTTLGDGVARELAMRHVDVDDCYWVPTDPPYTTKRPPEERASLIRQRLGGQGWVLTGSFDGWGDDLVDTVDLIVFVATPTPIRMKRLRAREWERHGDRILPGGDMHAIHSAFYQWASQYDVPGFSGRSRSRHETWLAERRVPVIRLDGTGSPNDLIAEVVAAARSGPIQASRA